MRSSPRRGGQDQIDVSATILSSPEPQIQSVLTRQHQQAIPSPSECHKPWTLERLEDRMALGLAFNRKTDADWLLLVRRCANVSFLNPEACNE